jgi:hypothetical protein
MKRVQIKNRLASICGLLILSVVVAGCCGNKKKSSDDDDSDFHDEAAENVDNDKASKSKKSSYKVGDRVEVEWKGNGFPSTITQVVGNNSYRIHYDNYSSKWDEVVGPSRILGPAGPPAKKTANLGVPNALQPTNKQPSTPEGGDEAPVYTKYPQAEIQAPKSRRGVQRRGIIRNSPNFRATEVARLTNGTRIGIMERRRSGWLRITWYWAGGNNYGWVHKDVVRDVKLTHAIKWRDCCWQRITAQRRDGFI